MANRNAKATTAKATAKAAVNREPFACIPLTGLRVLAKGKVTAPMAEWAKAQIARLESGVSKTGFRV